MAGALTEVAPDRRAAILDVAERLIRTKGYERMSVQEIQDELGISRGAIYHYFGSKEDLLAAVVDRISDMIMAVLQPIVGDSTMTAEAKLQQVFVVAGHWKTERRDLMRRLVDVWMSDDNAVARVKLRHMTLRKLLPLLIDILRQGRAEGTFTLTSADHGARVLLDLLEGTGEAAAELLIKREEGGLALDEIRRTFDAYNEAIERTLGLPPDTFTSIDEHTLRAWFG